jgi:PAS domain S-box-containing protein
VTALARHLPADFAALWELSPDGRLLLRAGFGWQPGHVGRATIPAGEGSYAGHALRTGAPVLVEDASAEAWLRAPPLLAEHGIDTALLVPIHGRDGPVGALGVYWRQPAAFAGAAAQLLARVARLLATVVVDWHRVTARLDASEGKLAAIFDSALDAILVADDRRVLIEANPAACTLYGRSREEIVGQPIEAFTPGADAGLAQADWEAFVVAGEQSGIFRVLRPDGSTRITDYRARAHFLPGLHLSVLRDVSEQHRAQEALEAAGRSKDEFLAMLAHELRNPLAPVVTAIEILRHKGGDAAVRQRLLEVLTRQTRNMARLIEDLMDASRITRGTIELRPERIELSQLVERAVEGSTGVIEARGHHLTVALPPVPIWLQADPVRLEQVLTNLLNNAAKFTPAGGRIAVEVAAEPGEAVLRVRDDGQGIAADLLPSIFDLFVQADRSLDRTHGGLGIGLTLVRNLVRFHGGSVSARSDGPGRGSEFEVRLPLAESTTYL